jgi:hypothetical protein
MLITFFGFCASRKWIIANPAKELKAPRNIKPNEVVPYTLLDESRILAACDQIGGGKHNRSGPRFACRTSAHFPKMRCHGIRTSVLGDSGCARKRQANRCTFRFPKA